jgi:hypothetical protein
VIRIALLLAPALAGCVIFEHKLEVPAGDEPTVLLCSTAMPEPIHDIARHSWFAVRGRGETTWQRIEVGGFGSGPFDGVDDVRLHKIWRGPRAEKAIACLRQWADFYQTRDSYLPWPGPNSNTYVDRLLRRCKLDADLPVTAIGKDYRGWIGAGITSGRTGIQLETPIAGLKLGLTEGIELHILGLGFGLDLWPPALIIPFGGGRLGFADR